MFKKLCRVHLNILVLVLKITVDGAKSIIVFKSQLIGRTNSKMCDRNLFPPTKINYVDYVEKF